MKLTTKELIEELENIIGGKNPDDVMGEIAFNEQYEVTYENGGYYEGYSVFVPKYKNNPTIGYPYVIFAKKGSARLSTEEESLKF